MSNKKGSNNSNNSNKQQASSAPAAAAKSTNNSNNNNNKASSSSVPAPAATTTTSTTATTTKFQLPKASPIANYKDDELTDRQKFLLSKMENMKLYKPKALPPPRLNRNRGWFHVLLEKYNIETALYMIEPWERWILNILLLSFICLICYWTVWTYNASTQYWREYLVPFVKEIIA